jgi:hypothetical protein
MTENEQRAERAYRTLLAYGKYANGDEDVEANMTDLLTDLRHLSDQYAVDWDDMLARIDLHYTAETQEDAR